MDRIFTGARDMGIIDKECIGIGNKTKEIIGIINRKLRQIPWKTMSRTEEIFKRIMMKFSKKFNEMMTQSNNIIRTFNKKMYLLRLQWSRMILKNSKLQN